MEHIGLSPKSNRELLQASRGGRFTDKNVCSCCVWNRLERTRLCGHRGAVQRPRESWGGGVPRVGERAIFTG